MIMDMMCKYRSNVNLKKIVSLKKLQKNCVLILGVSLCFSVFVFHVARKLLDEMLKKEIT